MAQNTSVSTVRVKIKEDGVECVINTSDFDENLHSLARKEISRNEKTLVPDDEDFDDDDEDFNEDDEDEDEDEDEVVVEDTSVSKPKKKK